MLRFLDYHTPIQIRNSYTGEVKKDIAWEVHA